MARIPKRFPEFHQLIDTTAKFEDQVSIFARRNNERNGRSEQLKKDRVAGPKTRRQAWRRGVATAPSRLPLPTGSAWVTSIYCCGETLVTVDEAVNPLLTRIATSTRRFCWRPSRVSFSATGFSSPYLKGLIMR